MRTGGRGLVYPRIGSTDVDSLRLLASFSEAFTSLSLVYIDVGGLRNAGPDAIHAEGRVTVRAREAQLEVIRKEGSHESP
jgi:hypothetical protein